MKKVIMMAACCTILLSSCGTYAGAGAGTGAYFGGHIGSAIGGITGGYRGHALGSLIGMASGAAIGAAVGAEQDAAIQRQQERRMEQRRQEMRRAEEREYRNDYNYAPAEPTVSMESLVETVQNLATIRNLQLNIEGGNTMRRGGEAKITFELMNTSEAALYDVMPDVTLSAPAKHIFVSPNITVECITPGEGIRYTAKVWTSRNVRPGTYTFNVCARQEGKIITQNQQVRIEITK